MKLSKLLRDLSYGKLSNLSIANSGDGTITNKGLPQIILAANEGLLRLYSRFVLKEDAVFVEMLPNVTQYHLSSRYALSQKAQYPKNYHYIIDHGEPFEDNAIRIVSVMNECGYEYPLNDETKWNSLFTPQPLVLQLPRPIEGRPLSISYQARHSTLVAENLDAQIELPDTLYGALLSFVAHQIYSNMGGQDNIVKSQEQLASYELVCTEVENKDTVSNTISNDGVRFQNNGWI